MSKLFQTVNETNFYLLSFLYSLYCLLFFIYVGHKVVRYITLYPTILVKYILQLFFLCVKGKMFKLLQTTYLVYFYLDFKGREIGLEARKKLPLIERKKRERNNRRKIFTYLPLEK